MTKNNTPIIVCLLFGSGCVSSLENELMEGALCLLGYWPLFRNISHANLISPLNASIERPLLGVMYYLPKYDGDQTIESETPCLPPSTPNRPMSPPLPPGPPMPPELPPAPPTPPPSPMPPSAPPVDGSSAALSTAFLVVGTLLLVGNVILCVCRGMDKPWRKKWRIRPTLDETQSGKQSIAAMAMPECEHVNLFALRPM
jgi:hypothetical protein